MAGTTVWGVGPVTVSVVDRAGVWEGVVDIGGRREDRSLSGMTQSRSRRIRGGRIGLSWTGCQQLNLGHRGEVFWFGTCRWPG